MKSAYELAMERLEKTAPSMALTDEQKQQIAELQRQEGVRVIKPPHALGFLDPDLPPRSQTAAPSAQAAT